MQQEKELAQLEMMELEEASPKYRHDKHHHMHIQHVHNIHHHCYMDPIVQCSHSSVHLVANIYHMVLHNSLHSPSKMFPQDDDMS